MGISGSTYLVKTEYVRGLDKVAVDVKANKNAFIQFIDPWSVETIGLPFGGNTRYNLPSYN